MSSLENFIPFVNGQIEFHEKQANKFSGSNEFRKKMHLSTSEKFKELHTSMLEAMDSLLNNGSTAKSTPSKLSLIPEDLEGLPEELINELSISEADKTEFLILNIIQENGDVASLDKILVGIYKKNGEIMKRPTLTARLYKMSQKDLIFNVQGKKGVYSTRELSPEEIEKLK